MRVNFGKWFTRIVSTLEVNLTQILHSSTLQFLTDYFMENSQKYVKLLQYLNLIEVHGNLMNFSIRANRI